MLLLKSVDGGNGAGRCGVRVWSRGYWRGIVDGYELEIEQIHRAASAARSAGDQLAAMEVGCRIGGVSGALCRSRSGEQVRILEDSWLRRGREFSSSLVDHGTKLTWAAGDYATNDALAEEAFRPVRVGGQERY